MIATPNSCSHSHDPPMPAEIPVRKRKRGWVGSSGDIAVFTNTPSPRNVSERSAKYNTEVMLKVPKRPSSALSVLLVEATLCHWSIAEGHHIAQNITFMNTKKNMKETTPCPEALKTL